MIYTHDLDPILLQLGPLRVAWYGLMYVLAFAVAYVVILRSIRRGKAPLTELQLSRLTTHCILGLLLGGRLGWILFYGGSLYWNEPWRIVMVWRGGMSFHGGLLGYLAGLWLYARREKQNIVRINDLLVPWVALGLGFGRIGNFINGELYGKPTDGSWGVIFPRDALGLPRHPSQLYEAFLEGLLLCMILCLVRRLTQRAGWQTATFLFGYGVIRFSIEFVRLPDRDIGYLAGGWFTMGQLLSTPMIAIGLAWLGYLSLQKPSPALAATPSTKKGPTKKDVKKDIEKDASTPKGQAKRSTQSAKERRPKGKRSKEKKKPHGR